MAVSLMSGLFQTSVRKPQQVKAWTDGDPFIFDLLGGKDSLMLSIRAKNFRTCEILKEGTVIRCACFEYWDKAWYTLRVRGCCSEDVTLGIPVVIVDRFPAPWTWRRLLSRWTNVWNRYEIDTFMLDHRNSKKLKTITSEVIELDLEVF